MQKRSSTKRLDMNQLAASIVAAATRGETPMMADGKNPLAVALGRLGGLKGGKARAAKLSPDQRKNIAQRAARERWRKQEK